MENIRGVHCALGLLVICACVMLAAFAQHFQRELPAGGSRAPIEQRDVLFSQDPNQRNAIGGPCRNSNHCQKELCCLLSRDHTRTCQPLAELGEHCTEFQVKGGAYPDHCPCLKGLCSPARDRPFNQGANGNGVCVLSSEKDQDPPF